MEWGEIPQRTRAGSYEVNVGLDYLETFLIGLFKDGLELNPDFQRGHVWTLSQKEQYIEYFLSGGESGKVLYFNKPSWQMEKETEYDDFVCVDGLQRVTAIREFLKGEVKAFGQFVKDFGLRIRLSVSIDSLRININNLQTKREVLEWYVQMNSGGTPHTTDEIKKVNQLIAIENKKVK